MRKNWSSMTMIPNQTNCLSLMSWNCSKRRRLTTKKRTMSCCWKTRS